MSNPFKLVGVVGGRIGSDPFNERTYSGAASYMFRTMARKGVLHRAFGADLPVTKRALLMAKNFHPSRSAWSRKYYLDVAYREALSEELVSKLTADDEKCCFFQIGAMFDLPSRLKGRSRVFSYHDGNLPEAIRGGQMTDVPRKTLDAALEYEKRLALRCDLIFTICESLRRSFISDFGVDPDRVIAVGGGANLDELPEPNPAKDYDTQEILFVGIEFERKGGPNLLRAFRDVKRKFPKAKLHIVGPRQLSIPTEMSDGVVYHGFVSRKTEAGAALFRSLYDRCSVSVLPSLYEPFGLASVEALMNQIPAVVTGDWGGLDIVQPGFNGFHVRKGNVEELATALCRCLKSPEMLKAMGENGRDYALQRFTWDAVIDRICEAVARSQASEERSAVTV